MVEKYTTMQVTQRLVKKLQPLKVRSTESNEDVVWRLLAENQFANQVLKQQFPTDESLDQLSKVIVGRLRKEYIINPK